MTFLAHPSAIIDPGAQIGPETRIWHFVHVSGGARIGQRCVLGQGVFVADNVVIGDGVKIQNNVSVYDGVVLEDDVFCGPSVVFTNVVNPRSHVSRKHAFGQTLVQRGASIGANATIVCGVTLGRYCFIGAGAVVTRDVADFAVVVGNPAHAMGWMCRCGERLYHPQPATTCTACNTGYVLSGRTLSCDDESLP
ncbi:MAG: N-acetyltransferase [Bradymonadaceae bacterium]|nr:N-acetyltransferase [Lujinxingiaceae bacterium]